MSIQIIKRTIFVIFILMPVYYLNGQTELPESQHYFFKKLADGVYAAIHNDDGGFAICNAGIVDLGDKTIVIDPFISPTAARDLKKHAESLTEKPVSLVLNLDPHNDHTRGNQVFSPEADIIGTANARRYIENTFHNGVEYEKKASPKERTKTGSLNYLCPRNSKSGDLAVFMKEALYFYITYYLKNKRKLESIGWITPHQLQNKKCQLIIRSIKVDCANFSNQLRKKHK